MARTEIGQNKVQAFIYDNNGNIKTLVRHGKSQVSTEMDSLTYNYYVGTNKLTYVDDVGNSANYGTDIDDQSANNYLYDSIGNLVKDVSEQIDTIIWNVGACPEESRGKNR